MAIQRLEMAKKSIINYKNVRLFFYIFYFVGTIGTIIPVLRPYFIKLTPFALLLSIIAIVLFHESKLSFRLFLSFFTVYILAYLVEVAGVNTGLIFGEYQYGSGLGLKIFHTPLFIGINWVMLVYASSSILNSINLQFYLKAGLASLLMLIYDLILEQVAPYMDMWYWKADKIPFQNYVAWFLIAYIFHMFLYLFKINTRNKIAPVLFGIQIIFFLTLTIYLNFSR